MTLIRHQRVYAWLCVFVLVPYNLLRPHKLVRTATTLQGHQLRNCEADYKV